MAYITMKKLIKNANNKLQIKAWTKKEYSEYKATQQKKLDVFFATGALTEAQYKELCEMWS